MLTAVCDMCSEEKSSFTRHRTLVETEEKTIGAENGIIAVPQMGAGNSENKTNGNVEHFNPDHQYLIIK